MEVVLYDMTTSLGHHAVYFNRILSICVERGYKVYVLFEDPSKIGYRDYPKVQILDPAPYRGFIFKLMFKVARILNLTGLLSLVDVLTVRRVVSKQKLKEATVFFPYLDSVLPTINYRLGQKIMNFRYTGIYMLPLINSAEYFDDPMPRREREKYLRYACSCLFLHDSYTRSFTMALKRNKFFTLPELLDLKKSKANLTEVKNEASGRVIIGIVGSLVRKKNFMRFLETASRLKSEHYFLIVGKWPKNTYSESEIDQMNKYLEEIKEYSWQDTDAYIPTEENYNELISVCDVVWLHHPQHPFSSNSLIKAMAMRKPVLVAPGFIMEEVVRTYNWSSVVEDDASALVKAIQDIKESFQVPNEEHKRLMEDHAPEKFRAQILNALSACE